MLGKKSSNHISRHERHLRVPKLKTALAYEIIFGTPLKSLFRGMYEEVEEKVMERAYRLYMTVEKRTDEAGKKKAALMKEMLVRATGSDNQKNV